jgi:serralysin
LQFWRHGRGGGANVGFNPGADWHVVNTGDYNGDGKADIVWQNHDGTPAVWLMNGTSLISGANVGFDPGSDWHVVPQHHDLFV